MILGIYDNKLELRQYGNDSSVTILISVPPTIEGARELGKAVYKNKYGRFNISSSVDDFEADTGVPIVSLMEEACQDCLQEEFDKTKQSILKDFNLTKEQFVDLCKRLSPFMPHFEIGE